MKLKIMLVLLALLCPIQQVFAEDLGDCMNALNYDAELQPIRDKVALILHTGNEQTFGMLANENRPTSDEAQAVYKWAIKREQCFKSYPPPPNNPVAQIAIGGFNEAQSLILDLYKGSITYGQFAKQRQESFSAIQARINGIVGQQPQQGWQQQMQPQQQMQQQQNQPKPYVPPRTTQSRCSWQGNQWVCDTSPSGIDSSIYQQNR